MAPPTSQTEGEFWKRGPAPSCPDMPFVALIVLAFALGMIWNKSASRQTYIFFYLAAAVVTVYFMLQ